MFKRIFEFSSDNGTKFSSSLLILKKAWNFFHPLIPIIDIFEWRNVETEMLLSGKLVEIWAERNDSYN